MMKYVKFWKKVENGGQRPLVRKLISNGAIAVVICEKILQYFHSLINCIYILAYVFKKVYKKVKIKQKPRV